MRKGRSSLTALAVASARVLASTARGAAVDPHDRVAARLLPGAVSAMVRAAGLTPAATRASLGFVDHVALRSAMIDRLLRGALERGIRQVVILGAGLDSRAHRLSELRNAVVYEVDHPDGQRMKQERAHALEVAADALHYVPADFEQLGMTRRLQEAGHRADEPSFFVLEGLVPYLRREVIERVLHELSNAAAPGSQLVVTYVTPDMLWLRHMKLVLLLSLRAIGEPLLSPMSAEQLAALLGEAGFAVEHDSDTRDWARVLTPAGSRKPLIVYERLASAVKR